MENNVFTYQYSAQRSREAERIRSKYLPSEPSKLDVLKGLDRRVQSAGMIEALCLGVIGALVFGIGMCFFLGVFAGPPVATVLPMIAGTLMMLPAYPLYRYLSKKTREKLAPEILKLSEEILND